MAKKRVRGKDWYKISVDTLRGWMIFLLVVAGMVGAYFAFQRWESYALRRQASHLISEARILVQKVQSEEGMAAFREQFQTGLNSLQAARTHYGAERYGRAVADAGRSRAVLLSILDALREKGSTGEAHFIAVQGGVEYRRGSRGGWREARGRDVLYPGDEVRTSSDGSAEIMFLGGTLYAVRSDTHFIVKRSRSGEGQAGEQTVQLEYGWVDLDTAQQASKVTTPKAEAWAEPETEAAVAFDREKSEGRFAAYAGSVAVRNRSGVEQRVESLQMVTQRGDLLSQAQALPRAPALLSPPDNLEVNFDQVRELVLSWAAVPGAMRYALQVSRNRLFADNIIDVSDRAKTSGTLGLRGEGAFVWRVAASTAQRVQGPWSAPRRFRIASYRGGGEEGDKTPPRLDLEEIQAYGSIFIVQGKTEPGAAVWINDESVTVEADGSFTKTVQMLQEGWAFIEVKARDTWGNEALRRQRVYVESI